MTKIQNMKIMFAVCMLLFAAIPAFAAEISFEAKSKEAALGQQFQVDAVLNTGNEAINAVEGNVLVPGDMLELKEVRTANSIVSFWVEKPGALNNGQFRFSGVTPGGFRGEKGLLFSLILVPKKEGQGTLGIARAKTLLNDGKGTEASLSIAPYQFAVSKSASAPMVPQKKDTSPPESFAPEIARNPSLFGGKWFLVFATQDKESEIDHYEVKESSYKLASAFQEWLPVASPYVLSDQALQSYVFVKAVDISGNARIIKINPQHPLPWYENYGNWAILIGGVFIVLFAQKLWRKKYR